MQPDDPLDRELRYHIDRQVDGYLRAGMPEAEARRRVRLEFGGLSQLTEDCRDVRRGAWLDAIRQDARFAIRSFGRNSRFAFSAIVAIAIAVGGATAVFSVVDRNLIRPLPYAHGDRLISVGVVAPVITDKDWMFAGTYQEWKRTPILDAMTAWKGVSDCDRSDGAPERLGCAAVEASFLPVLGVTTMIGRNFTLEEDQPGANPVAIISHAYWAARLGGDRNAVGKTLTIDGTQTRIVGVLPPAFETPSLASADVLLPLRLRQDGQRQRLIYVLGRLRDDQSLAAATAELQTLYEKFIQEVPANLRQAIQPRFRVATLRDQQTQEYRLALWMLLGAVLSFVSIACANVANLLLARSAARTHEFAVRASLGASKARLAQQALTESVLLGVVGGALGCALAYLLLAVFRAIAPAGTMRIHEASLDLRVLGFAAALSLVAALLFGLAPALERFRSESLARPRIAGSRSKWLRLALVGLQLAISVVLLTTSGLFLLSLWRLQRSPLGFEPETVATAAFILPEQRYAKEEQQVAFFTELERRLEEIPGVSAAAITDSLPPGGDPRSFPLLNLLPGGAAPLGGNGGAVKWRFVSTNYLRTLGIPILRGRGFAREDRNGPQKVVVNDALARRVFGDADPVGKQIRLWNNVCEIAGVAANARNAGLTTTPDPEIYVLRGAAPNDVSRNQRPPFGWRQAIAVSRSSLSARSAQEALLGAIHEVDPSIAATTGTLQIQVGRYLARPRFQTVLLAFFALMGLVLAAVGLYGLTSLLVAARTREVGVRVALGATPQRIVAMMMKDGAAWTVAGVALGLAAAVAVARSLRSLLFEVAPLDAGVFAAAALLLGIVVLAGTFIPSLRASRIDATRALREE